MYEFDSIDRSIIYMYTYLSTDLYFPLSTNLGNEKLSHVTQPYTLKSKKKM